MRRFGSSILHLILIITLLTGNVYSAPSPAKKPAVVILEDIHLNPEAQFQIASHLKELIAHRNTSLRVGVEGSIGQFDFAPYQALSRPDIVQGIAKQFVKDGRIGAMAYAGLTLNRWQIEKMVALGIEDTAFYLANVQAYRDAMKGKKKLGLALQQEESTLHQWALNTLREPAWIFFKHQRGYRNGSISLSEHIQWLSKYEAFPKNLTVRQIMPEVRAAEERLMARMCKSEEERAVIRRIDTLVLQRKLSEFALMPDEWNEYQKLVPSSWYLVPGKDQNQFRLGTRNQELGTFKRFYRLADQRSVLMAEQVIKKNLDALIIGGFHSPEVKRLLETRGYTVTIITPLIKNTPKETSNTYLRMFLNTPTNTLAIPEVMGNPANMVLGPPRWRAETPAFFRNVYDGKANGSIVTVEIFKEKELETYKPQLDAGVGAIITDIPFPTALDPLKAASLIKNTIITIAADIRSEKKLEEILRNSFSAKPKALLLLSGGGPWRRALGYIPFGLGLRFLPMDSMKLLALAKKIRAENPDWENIKLWMAANPYKESIKRIQKKFQAGAEGIVTQPIFTKGAAQWVKHVRELAPENIPVIAGIAPIPSVNTLNFWLFLIGKRLLPPWRILRELLPVWPGYELQRIKFNFIMAEHTSGLLEKRRLENLFDMLAQIRWALGGWAHVHIMALTATAAKDVPLILDTVAIYDSVERLRQMNATPGDSIKVVMDPLLNLPTHHTNIRPALEALEAELKDLESYNRPQRIELKWIFPHQSKGKPPAILHPQPPVSLQWHHERMKGKDVYVNQKDLVLNLQALKKLSIEEIRSLVRQELHRRSEEDRIVLEDFTRGSLSILNKLNGAYWLDHNAYMEHTTGKAYTEAIGGSSDDVPGVIKKAAHDYWMDFTLAHTFDPEKVFAYMEVGVSHLNFARAFTEEVARLAKESHREVSLKNMVFILTCYSEKVEKELNQLIAITPQLNGIKLHALRLDLTNPEGALEPYRNNILRFRITNVLDCLPTDVIKRIGDKFFMTEVRTTAPKAALEALTQKTGITLDYFLTHLFDFDTPRTPAFYSFWSNLLPLIQTEQRAVLMKNKKLRYTNWDSEVAMPTSDAAAEAVTSLIPYLHAFGAAEVVDIMGTEETAFQSYRGPFRFDGSFMHWLNFRRMNSYLNYEMPAIRINLTSLEELGDKPNRYLMEIRKPLPKMGRSKMVNPIDRLGRETVNGRAVMESN